MFKKHTTFAVIKEPKNLKERKDISTKYQKKRKQKEKKMKTYLDRSSK